MCGGREGLTPLVVAEGPADGPSQADLPVLQVFPLQQADRDWLAVDMVTEQLVEGDGPCDDQHVLEQENVQLLQGNMTHSIRDRVE